MQSVGVEVGRGRRQMGLIPQGQMGFKGGGGYRILMARMGQWIPDGRLRHLFAHRKEGEKVVRNFSSSSMQRLNK